MSTDEKKIVMAKELVDYFARQQIQIHYAYARAIIRACPQAIRGRYIRAGDAWTWWVLHPGFAPFGAAHSRGGGGNAKKNTKGCGA